MIYPRIRENLRNHTQIDLQSDGVKDLVCVADGYPEADVVWIRGFDFESKKCIRFYLSFLLLFSQHPIRIFLHGISHEHHSDLIRKRME